MTRSLIATAVIAAGSLLAATGASADELSYSYLEAGYLQTNIDDSGTDADGWRLGGSVALGESFHLFGNYDAQELDDINVDVDTWRLGLGWNRSIADAHDLVVRAAYLELDADVGPASASVDGWEAEVGVRSALTPNFETYVALGYADADDVGGDGDLFGKLSGQYKFNPTWGLVATVSINDDANEVFIGPRISF